MFDAVTWYDWVLAALVVAWLTSWALFGAADLLAPLVGRSRSMYAEVLDYFLGRKGRSLDYLSQIRANLDHIDYSEPSWLQETLRKILEASQIAGQDKGIHRQLANRIGDVVRLVCEQCEPSEVPTLVSEIKLVVDDNAALRSPRSMSLEARRH